MKLDWCSEDVIHKMLYLLSGSTLTMKSPVVISSTLVSRFFKISLKTRPISFFDTLETAHISDKPSTSAQLGYTVPFTRGFMLENTRQKTLKYRQ